MSAKTSSDTLLSGPNAGFIEAAYQRFLENPESLEPEWRAFFERLENGAGRVRHAGGPSWARADWPPRELEAPRADRERAEAPAGEAETRRATLDSIRALMMIRAYRVRGHLNAKLDPLGLMERPAHEELSPASYGFTEADYDRPVFLDGVLGLEAGTVREILEILKRTYCGSVGVEFMHIAEPAEKAWIQERIEGRDKEIQFTPEGKRAILQKLIEAETFEHFLAKKFVGTKRFGLDGAEAVVPALEAVIKVGGHLGIREIVIGMAHRGRLNVLANVMKKPFRAIFHEFHGGSAQPDDVQGSGDVKYHLGTSTNREFDGNPVHLSLTPNPSHLEWVNPVALGKTRAKQAQLHDTARAEVMALLIHGDAAFAGQGIVAEGFMLSDLKGYRTGGSLHFIINNQIGFTTSPHHSRSSPYPSDVAKMVQAPIFHVNGDDPEAVVYVTKLATEFRQAFKKDVVVDMVCYRRFGHNEADEPSFTQPKMYTQIKSHPSTPEIYGEKLGAEGLVGKGDAETSRAGCSKMLSAELAAAKDYTPPRPDRFEGVWEGFRCPPKEKLGFVKTGVAEVELRALAKLLTTWPEGFHIHKTLARVLEARRKAIEKGQGIDWATAEALALATLLKEGFGVRLAGQDTIRGTFSQRHAEFVDQETEAHYSPLAHIKSKGLAEVLDSPLSEAGVLGFEYGYSQAEPRTLVAWEAQFGDFGNVAQAVIDQFIASGEAKWLRSSGIVLLLPHGHEGQGPEHSSGRPERFLQLSAEYNLQVADCTTPANYFHLLRRQMHRNFRKPLIVMTPKSLLRHKLAISKLADFTGDTGFRHTLGDPAEREGAAFRLKPDGEITRLVLCTGKVFYDLYEARERAKVRDVYLFRLEQLYPFPHPQLVKKLARFPKLKTLVWCQEEPKNMGAWSFAEPRIEAALIEAGFKGMRPVYAGRAAAAAPATGLASRHEKEQSQLVAAALGLEGKQGS
jgi:2-oxoglutarate dehydrogenase E1 component